LDSHLEFDFVFLIILRFL